MGETSRSGVRICYSVTGHGEPVVLVHGYSGSSFTNWQLSGCIDALASRYRVIAVDLRGHGRSEKPLRAGAYSIQKLAADVLAVMDAEGLEEARIAGYSLGGMVVLELLLNHPERLMAAAIGGMGAHLPRRFGEGDICRGCDDANAQTKPARRVSARFVTQYVGHMNPIAMLAAYRGLFRPGWDVDTSRLSDIETPVLCIAGTRDHLCDGTRRLAGAIGRARLELLPGETHLSALGAPRFRETLLEFFESV